MQAYNAQIVDESPSRCDLINGKKRCQELLELGRGNHCHL